jgi:tRNA dimethylallyltransferase
VSGEPVRVVCGPTAAGKTAIALALAERWPVTILSADSRQVYRGFDLGTAKPSAAERARVPHRGIDLVEPAERFSASAWAAAAEGWIDEARAAGRIPLVVGGTGLYIRSLFAPLFDEPELDPDRRRLLERALAELPTPELARWVRALDPVRAALGRTQLLRAIEVALLTGRQVSALHRERARAPRHAARYLVVDPGPPLAERIAARTRAMLDAGWEDEVRGLVATVPGDAPAWNATGYDAVRRLVRGEATRERAIEEIVVATRQYAKRQRTWFRNQLVGEAVTRVNPDDPDARERVDAWWRGEDRA